MLRGAVYGLLAASIWGGMYVVSDVVLMTIPPFILLVLRLLLGAVVLMALWWRGRATRGNALSRRLQVQLLVVGVVGFGVSLGAQFVGTDLSTAINGALVTSASPAFITLFAVLILGERLTVRRLLAIVLATAGVVLIIDPRAADFSSDTFVGNLVLALAALTWGLYSVMVRRFSQKADTLTVTLWAFAGGLLLTVPAAGVELGQRPIGEITFGVVLGVLYLGVVSTAVAQWMWNRAFALVDASVAGLFFFAQPVVGAALSVALLGQAMTLAMWIGGLMIVVGVALSLTPARRRAVAKSNTHPTVT